MRATARESAVQSHIPRANVTKQRGHVQHDPGLHVPSPRIVPAVDQSAYEQGERQRYQRHPGQDDARHQARLTWDENGPAAGERSNGRAKPAVQVADQHQQGGAHGDPMNRPDEEPKRTIRTCHLREHREQEVACQNASADSHGLPLLARQRGGDSAQAQGDHGRQDRQECEPERTLPRAAQTTCRRAHDREDEGQVRPVDRQ